MEELHLQDYQISDETALDLVQCCHNIQHLSLASCSLTPIGWKTILGGVANMNGKVITVFVFI